MYAVHKDGHVSVWAGADLTPLSTWALAGSVSHLVLEDGIVYLVGAQDARNEVVPLWLMAPVLLPMNSGVAEVSARRSGRVN